MMRTSFLSESLYRSVDINVIVPMEVLGIPGEAKKEGPTIFKTLYLLNGYSGNQDDWLTYSNIRQLAEQYRLAVVMPAGGNSFYVDGAGLGNQWGRFVGEELVDFTRKMFPLSPKREDTFLGGLSMGGFGAARLGFYYHRHFSKLFSLSGAFITDKIAGKTEGYRDEVADYEYYHSAFGDLKQLQNSSKDPFWCARQAVQAENAPELYMACGEEDFLIENNRDAKRKLEEIGVRLHYLEAPGIHDWRFWNQHLEPAIQWLLEER